MRAQNQRVKRVTKLGTLNDNNMPNGILGMGFIEPINGRYVLVKIDFLFGRVQLNNYLSTDGDTVARSLMRWVRTCGGI